MSTYSPESQMNFIIQWFKGWSEFQKEDFVHVLSKRIQDAGVKEGDTVNNLVNGINNLETSGRPPSLFVCQVKLFNEWWTSWASDDRTKMRAMFKEADPVFYASLESDMIGESRTLNEDFMTVTAKEEVGIIGTENAETFPRPNAPVFNVTKVIINNGPSSFSSMDNDSVSNGGGADSGGDEVTVSNGGCDSAEPVATEI